MKHTHDYKLAKHSQDRLQWGKCVSLHRGPTSSKRVRAASRMPSVPRAKQTPLELSPSAGLT